jgi:hypothetical protein
VVVWWLVPLTLSRFVICVSCQNQGETNNVERKRLHEALKGRHYTVDVLGIDSCQ